MKAMNEAARLPPSMLQRCPVPPHPPAGCTSARDLELWHGREEERQVDVTEYRSWPLGEGGPVMVVRTIGDDLLRISDAVGRPIPRSSQLWAAADTLAAIWKGAETMAPVPHEVTAVEREPFSTAPALWRRVWEGGWHFLALLWHGWQHDTPLYVRKEQGLRAVWESRDVFARESWHNIRRGLSRAMRAPPPWSWWQAFTLPGPHHGAARAMPIVSWTGTTSVCTTLAARIPGVRVEIVPVLQSPSV